jgi:hypothetical protein
VQIIAGRSYERACRRRSAVANATVTISSSWRAILIAVVRCAKASPSGDVLVRLALGSQSKAKKSFALLIFAQNAERPAILESAGRSTFSTIGVS